MIYLRTVMQLHSLCTGIAAPNEKNEKRLSEEFAASIRLFYTVSPGQRFGAAATPLIQNTLENKGDFEKMKLGIVGKDTFSYLHISQ